MIRRRDRHFRAKDVRLLLAHLVELIKRFGEACRHGRFDLLHLAFKRSGGQPDHARQTQQRRNVRLGFNSKFSAQSVRCAEIRSGNIVVDSDGSGALEFIVQRNVHMPAPHPFADNLAHARLNGSKPSGTRRCKSRKR